MRLDSRLRLSLLWRMVAALAVLAVVTVFVSATAVLAGGLLAWLALIPVVYVLETLLLPFSGGSYGAVWSVLTSPLRVAVVAGIPLLPILYYRPVRDEIRAFRAELGTAGAQATETHPNLAKRTRRLAQQADIPAPDLYVADRRRAESYALGGRSNGTIIVTRGLVSALSDDELEAVLAHEISHLANGDSRIMNLVLVPMLVAERVGSDEPPTRNLLVRQPLAYLAHLGLWALLTVVTAVQGLCCQFGIATLSRGRELAADRGAAELTGSPGALVSALETLADGRSRPSEDKRTWAKSASALDILPRDASAARGPFRTHPRTETRIAYLEPLVREMVDGRRNAGSA